MPNGNQYRSAASRFRVLGENCTRQATATRTWNFDREIGPGPVRTLASGELADAAAKLEAAADDLVRLARVCEARAVLCDAYRREVEEYYALPSNAWPYTPYPLPDFPWISL